MQLTVTCNPGGTGSSRTSWNLLPAPAILRMHIMHKRVELKGEFPCLNPGGEIKATVLEIIPVDSVGPEPGIGYCGSGNEKNHVIKTINSGRMSVAEK